MSNPPSDRRSDKERLDDVMNDLDEDATRPGIAAAAADPPGGFASRSTKRDALEDKEDQEDRARASSSCIRGRSGRLGKEETNGGTEDIPFEDQKPTAVPVHHGKKVAAPVTDGSDSMAKATASGAAKPETTNVPEIILGEISAHPSPDERTRRLKPGKPVLEKLLSTSPGYSDKGGVTRAKHGDGMMHPFSRAIPETVPAPGPAIEFAQAGHGHGIMCPPSGAFPKTGATMGPVHSSGTPSSSRGTDSYAAQAGLAHGPHPSGVSPLFDSEGDDGYKEGVAGGQQPLDGLRATRTEAHGAFAMPGTASGNEATTHQGASQQGGGTDDSVAFSAFLAPDDAAAGQQRGGTHPQRWEGDCIVIPHEDGTVYEGKAVPAPSSAGTLNTSWWKPLKKHRVALVAATICAAVAGVVAPVAVSKRRSGAMQGDGTLVPVVTDSPTSERYVIIRRELQPLMNNTAAAFEDDTSPQHMALVWLADEDGRQVDWQDMLSLTQRFVLAVIFFATGGEGSWIKDYNFLSSENECNWNIEAPDSFWGALGAFCSGDNATVDEIKIGPNNVTGMLPEEIRLLSSLKSLDLSSNRLAGTIPSRLDHLQQLVELYLEENQLSGTVPSSLGSLSELQVLRLHVNKLSGSIPTSLGKLFKLRDLTLGFNQLTGTIPVELNNLSKLEQLFLNTNFLNGTLPITANSLPDLEIFDIGHNFLMGSIPGALFALSSLTSINFWGNALTGTLSPEFGKLTHLKWLQIPYNSLSGTLPPSLMDLSQLYGLSLGDNAFTGTIPSEVCNLTKLQALYLGGNGFEGTIPEAMGDLMELVDLQLAGNQFSGHVPQSLAQLKALSTLRLDNNNFIGDLGFLCNKSWVIFMADCHGENPEIKCECCNACCSDELGLVGPVYGCFAT